MSSNQGSSLDGHPMQPAAKVLRYLKETTFPGGATTRHWRAVFVCSHCGLRFDVAENKGKGRPRACIGLPGEENLIFTAR